MAQKTIQNVTRRGKNIAHIMKQHSAEIIADKRQRQRRSAQFKVVQEDCLPAQREASLQITRPCLVHAKSAMRIAATREKPLWQRNKVSRAEGFFKPDAHGAGEYPALLVELIIGGVQGQETAEICLRSKDPGSGASIKCSECAFVRVGGIIPCVAEIRKGRHSDPHRLGK